MRTSSGQADVASGRPGSRSRYWRPFATTRLVTWHSDIVALGRPPRLAAHLNDQLTAVLAPVRERHQDNLSLSCHGGRWGHPLHPTPATCPSRLWTGHGAGRYGPGPPPRRDRPVACSTVSISPRALQP
jgi:hypothetical protein